MIHVIPLQPYQQAIDQFKTIMVNIDSKLKIESKAILNNKKIVLSLKVDQLQGKYNEIMPQRRKRGLINGLGNILKDITGNLDDQDLRDIQKALIEMSNNQDKLKDNNNKQVQINHQMITRINEIKDIVNINTAIIHKEVQQTNNALSQFANLITLDQQYYRLDYAIETLTKHLDDLLDIIAFSKNKIISRHLLSEVEMQYIKDIFNKSDIHLPHDSMMLNLLEIKGLITNNKQLVYLIKIPNFTPYPYLVYKIIPIPIQNKNIFPQPPEYIILGTNQYKYRIDQCQVIYDTYYCPEEKLQPIANTCIPAIIGQQAATCNFTSQQPSEFIANLDENRIIIIPNDQPIEFSSNCTRSTNKITIASIITMRNCYVNIKGEIFQSRDARIFQSLQEHLPWNDITINHTFSEPNLKTLHNWTLDNIRDLQIKHEQLYLNSSTGHISLGIIIIGAIIAIYLCIRKKSSCITLISRKKNNAHLGGEELHDTKMQEFTNQAKRVESQF